MTAHASAKKAMTTGIVDTTPDGLAQAGIDVALGPRADLPITAWESMFIPMRLRDYLRDVTVPGVDGATVPLVSSERVLFTPQRRAAEPAMPWISPTNSARR